MTAQDQERVLALVARARAGDPDAWAGLVDRYSALVWAACRRHGLQQADAEDVASFVWLRLVERLDTIREPAALPGWLATTARRECLDILAKRARQVPVETADLAVAEEPASDAWLLREERRIAVRAAFADLSGRCRALLALLFDDPPAAYSAISSRLGVPVGSIGPSRQRCLAALRAHPLIAAIDDVGGRPVPNGGGA